MLDYAYFPHIVETAIEHADHATLLTLRAVSRRVCAHAERQLFRHVVVRPSSYDGRGYLFRSPRGCLPVQPWEVNESSAVEDAKREEDGRARLLHQLAHAEVIDVHKAIAAKPPVNERGEDGANGESGEDLDDRVDPDAPLLEVLSRIPTRRGEYHRFLAPFPSPSPNTPLTLRTPTNTYIQEYSVYVGSHWRHRTFYLEYPPNVDKYVVNLRYHVDRTLGELYGPAPSCDRIVDGPKSGPGPRQYVLICTECPPEALIPTVPTHGTAATQRRTVHTLLYELAAALYRLRCAQPRARIVLVGAEDFVGSLCGATSREEAGALFENKMRLAAEGEVVEARGVEYWTREEYRACVGEGGWEVETGPVELY